MSTLPFASPIPAALLEPGCAQTIQLVRPSGVWLGNGLWQPDGNTQVITGQGILYPSTADDLLALPEGERIVKSITLYWTPKFVMKDRVMYAGEEYHVVRVEPWPQYGYYKAIAQVSQSDEVGVWP
jgi:hypothetical protein